MSEKRVAFGAECTWWEFTTFEEPPPCPQCGGLTYAATATDWSNLIEQHEAHTQGFQDFVEWGRGQCFPDHLTLRAHYELATGMAHP